MHPIMRPVPPIALLLLGACADAGPTIVPPTPEAPADTGVVPDDTAPVPPDDDADNDGFSPAEGDCDDANVRVSPARDEDPDDGVDNDCDARVDEAFSGVTVGLITAPPTRTEPGAGELVRIDSVGRLDDTVPLASCAPMWLDVLGDGWVVNCGQSTVVRVGADGATTLLLDVSRDFETPPDFGLWGAAADADGNVYVSTIDRLVRIAPDGSVAVVADWVVALDDAATHEFAASAVAVDWRTGQVGLFDYFGGFATWSPAAAGAAPGDIDILAAGDLVDPALVTFTGTRSDRGAWVTPAIDAATGRTGLYAWDDGQAAWRSLATWSAENSEWRPVALAIDGGTGDAYVTANGGWYSTVWRVLDGGTAAHDLYRYGGTSPDTSFWGIAVQQ